jgi:hypothetical protein
MPKELARRRADHLLCFLACPFSPSDKADDLLSFIQCICDEIGRDIGAYVECVRSDKISTPGTVHTDIWKHLELADALIFDVTGENGNVLLELGVAAACRSQDNIVIIREQEDLSRSSKFLFDIAPSRHLLYSRKLFGSMEFRGQLKEALVHALTPAPYKPYPEHKTSFPFEIDLAQQGDSADLLSPPMLHRRIVQDGLEFGSLYIFRHSWMTVGDSDHELVRVQASMRCSERAPSRAPSQVWIGVALRSQHFFANYSHLVYVRPDGCVVYTQPLSESDYQDVTIRFLKGFRPSDFVDFSLIFGKNTFQIKVSAGGDVVKKTINLKNRKAAPHVRHAGKIRFQTYRCRAVLRSLKVEIDS